MLLALALAAAEPVILPFDKSDFDSLKQTVGVHLKDDRSARWKLTQPNARNYYCGWVNSKNSFGAYTGWQAFSVWYIKLDGDDRGARFLGSPVFFDPNDQSTFHFFSDCEKGGFNLYMPPAIPDN